MLDRETEALTGAARAFVREYRLTAGRDVHTFAKPRIVIGADPTADLVLDDAALSKFHCEITIADGAATIRDLGSRNGTFVDRVQILAAPLRDGATILLGRTELRFDLGKREVEISLSQRTSFGRLLGKSTAMRAVFNVLEAVADQPTTVLVQGESGTGKDLAAEALHIESARRDGPFIVVDCGAIPANLLEIELFGCEAGTFTGATTRRIGAFEAANGGTLLLDEIGELALELQPKLLRALDRHEVQRLGSSERIATDVRVIAATNRNLREEVNNRRFRSDLFYRLAVVQVVMPSLRDRADDIPLLVDAIVGDLGARDQPAAKPLLSGELVTELLRHQWPGNVRELRNYVEAAIVRGEYELAPPGELSIDIARPLRAVREQWIRHVERQYLERLLASTNNNVSAAARLAGVDRVHMHRLLGRVGIALTTTCSCRRYRRSRGSRSSTP
ncbi:MAG: sigma 54-interacting transcriptional regulator [Kofleriaceae bacterium]